MTALAAVGVWVLALVFLWSGTSKLRRPRLAAMAMVDFGVVRRPVAGLGRGLGAIEVALGLTLASGRLTGPALAVATLLLLVFSGLLARSLAAGKSFPCQCFGGEDDSISAGTLARTGGLALGAALLWLSLTAGTTDTAYTGAGDVPLRAVSAVGLVAAAVLAASLPKLLGWNRDTLGTFRVLADPDPGGAPQPEGRTALSLQEVTRS